MASRMIPLTALSSFLAKLRHNIFSSPSTSPWKFINSHVTQSKYQRFSSLVHKKDELSNQTLVFDLEGVLLKSFSLFPYFMLVAFEASGLIRSFVLLLLYPFIICLFGKESRLKIMVFLCFFGIRKDKFRIGTAVLPKLFLEDTASESYDIVMSCGRKIGVSRLPRVMVEGFLMDYIGVDAVMGKELKVFRGFYVGLMENGKKVSEVLSDLLVNEQKLGTDTIGMACFNKSLDHQLFKHCKEVYLVTKSEKRKWQILPKEKRLRPLIFHDGRIAFRPTPLDTLVMFMWLPLGICLFFIRVSAGTLLPFKLLHIVLSFSGNIINVINPENSTPSIKRAGLLYVCNHRTLLDPVAISLALCKPLTAVTYSLSRVNELISPIKTVRLTRDREKDGKTMAKTLSRGDLVVCPEGTTCREPYLLRFSPLFAELSDDIVPVAVEVEITMFYGSTASGMKCLDPIFHFANPHPTYNLKYLKKLDSTQTCNAGKKSNIEVANYVQQEIGKALGYECTSFTRKEKYKILAGNDGIV